MKTAGEVRGILKYMVSQFDEGAVQMRDIRLAYDDVTSEP